MSKRIYVGNLPWSVDKAGFEELFSPFGEIEEALVIANKYTGRSRGFGFVTYKNDADADKAMEAMNEKDVEGRKIVVKVARPSREEGRAEEEQKPKEEKQEQAEEETEEKPVKKPKKEKPAEEEQKPKEKPVKKPKKEKPAEEKKEETEEK
jgi:RNA recognition motif-containing protein